MPKKVFTFGGAIYVDFHKLVLGDVINIQSGEEEQIYYIGVFGCYKGAEDGEEFSRYSQQAALGMFEGSEATNVYEVANVRVTIEAGRTGGLRLGRCCFETNYIEPNYDTNSDVIDHLLAGKKKILARIYH